MSDLISRQAAIAHAVPLNLFGREVMMVSVSELENLPSVQPVVISKSENTTECEDAVSRTEAVEALYDWEQMYTWDEHCKEDGGESPYIVSPSSIIEKLPPVTPKQPGWIPTSVKPPEPFKLVLIQDSCGCYELNTYIPPRINQKQYPNGYWGEVGNVDFDYFDVEAWCPLPAPYRQEGENSERHDQ